MVHLIYSNVSLNFNVFLYFKMVQINGNTEIKGQIS